MTSTRIDHRVYSDIVQIHKSGVSPKTTTTLVGCTIRENPNMSADYGLGRGYSASIRYLIFDKYLSACMDLTERID